MPHVSQRILMRLQGSAQGPYEIRRAANLVIRMTLLGFLHAFLECTTDRKEVFPSFYGVV
jgi:hypothetical protein